MKLWIKISSENRSQGAWFYDLDYARDCARNFEQLIPVEFPDWPNVPDNNLHRGDGKYAGHDFPTLVDRAYRRGLEDGNAGKPVNCLCSMEALKQNLHFPGCPVHGTP